MIKDYFANAYSTLIVIVDNMRVTLRTLVWGDVKELAYFLHVLASLRMSFWWKYKCPQGGKRRRQSTSWHNFFPVDSEEFLKALNKEERTMPKQNVIADSHWIIWDYYCVHLGFFFITDMRAHVFKRSSYNTLRNRSLRRLCISIARSHTNTCDSSCICTIRQQHDSVLIVINAVFETSLD